MISSNSFLNRRRRFLSQIEGGAAIIPAASMVVHHADCEYPFRQNSDFWYLTGFDEPDAVALFLAHRPIGEQFVLFVLPKASDIEIWHGFRNGLEGAKNSFGADIAHSIDDLPQLLKHYLKGAEKIFFRVGHHPNIETLVLKVLAEQLDQVARTGCSSPALISPSPLIHQLRLIKEPEEVQRMREAARISSEAHEIARESVRPGMNEREIQAIIENHFLKKGARGPAYGTIAAGGDNACVLHYTSNNSVLVDGDLLLVDAGCSLVDYYNADITRTYPINGRFTPQQRELYELVLEAQQTAIAAVLPGQTTQSIHDIAVRVLVEGLVHIGLLKGSVESLIEQGLYSHLYMHRTGHWIGLDVHDVGSYRLGEFPVSLELGMVLTVEPGLYISDRLPVPVNQPCIDDSWKGIGIRIEDNILLTEGPPEVITLAAKKSLKDMER